jgi:cytochrome b561
MRLWGCIMREPNTYSIVSRLLGWAIALLASGNAVLSSTMPRTSKELALRGELRELHMWVGLALLLLVGARLFMWFKEGRVDGPGGLPRAVHAQGRLFAFTIYLLLFLAGLLGIGFAWGSGYKPPLIPMAFADNYVLWKFSGYFHSGISFTFLLMNLAVVLFATYVVMRYKISWLQAVPEPLIIQCFLGLLSTFYALVNTGSSKAPGVQILLAVAVVVWGLSVWRRQPPRNLRPA